MAKAKTRPTSRLPTGQDSEVGRELRDKGLLRKVNQLLGVEGYVLVFLYGPGDDPDTTGPYEIKVERTPASRLVGTDENYRPGDYDESIRPYCRGGRKTP